MLSGTDEQVGGGELLNRMVRLSSERVIRELLEEDQAGFWEEAATSDRSASSAIATGMRRGVCIPPKGCLTSRCLNCVGLQSLIGPRSGHCLPGHGGLLDRPDAYLLAAPVAYYLLRWSARWSG